MFKLLLWRGWCMRYVHLLSHLCSHSPSTLSSITVILVFWCQISYTNNWKRLYVPRKHLSVPCYFLALCDKRKHTAHTHQQAASQASADSGWRHPVWLPHSSLGFQHPVGRHRYRLTPQATIACFIEISVLQERGGASALPACHVQIL